MRLILLGAAGASALLASCAMPALPVPPPSVRTVEAIRRTAMPKLAIGTFIPAEHLRGERDKWIGSRADTIRPEVKSFSAYLGEAIATQLKAAGRFDAQSPLSISGTMTRNELVTGIQLGRATIEAEFVVQRSGSEIFRRRIAVSGEWPGNFIAGVAVPVAEQRYSGLYPLLAEKLLTDPGFLAAVQDPA